MNCLPDDKILDKYRLKDFANNHTNVKRKWKYVMETVENNVGKGENADYKRFLLFQYVFKSYFIRVIKSLGISALYL